MDVNLSGIVDVRELRKKFIELGLDGRIKTVREIVNFIDANNSGQLDFEEFFALMTQREMQGAQLTKFKNIFKNRVVSHFSSKHITTA
jgi:Ca2+-binding EF-hand superfamily protein